MSSNSKGRRMQMNVLRTKQVSHIATDYLVTLAKNQRAENRPQLFDAPQQHPFFISSMIRTDKKEVDLYK